MQKHVFVLATGGTGGHIFPAHALAHQLQEKGHKVFLCVDSRYYAYRDDSVASYIYTILSASPYGGVFKKIKAACRIAIGVVQALWVLLRVKPHVVVGFGGYPTFPTLFAARILGKKIVLHEQNSVFGRANAFLSRYVDTIATSFSHVKGMSAYQQHKIRYVGNPVREEIVAIGKRDFICPKDKIVILITAGSQGAQTFNTYIPEAIASLPHPLQSRLVIFQQCRQETMDQVLQAYGDTYATIELAPFFTNMAELLDKAHLVIARSGASTVAELSVAGKPAIFIPYPYAMDDHQTKNAHAIVEAGGAALIPESQLNKDSLATMLERILSESQLLNAMAKAMKQQGKPDATENLVKLVTNPLMML